MTRDEKTPRQRMSLVSLLVRDYDEAIAFYVGKLGFQLMEDTLASPHLLHLAQSLQG